MKNDEIIENFEKIMYLRDTNVLIITIYINTIDYKEKFVARLFVGGKPSRYVTVSKTLEQARKTIPFGFFNIGRDISDTRFVVESWI